MSDQDLKNSILKTISFFDLFDYPLTKIEVYKFLFQSSQHFNFHQIVTALDDLVDKELGLKHGVYFLVGRDNLVGIRQQRYRLANKKYKLAIKGARLLSLIPGVLFVGACNNIAMSNAKEQSDIDIFIITKKDRIWLVRLLTTLALTIFGLRRHGKIIANRLCLSFYVTEDNCDLSKIALTAKDPYLTFWVASLVPIYDLKDSYVNFIKNNSWIKNDLLNIFPIYPNSRRSIFSSNMVKYYRKIADLILQGVLGKIGNLAAKKLQLVKIKKNKKSIWQQDDNRVVINDKMLKFHENDRRNYYLSLWEEKLKTLFS